MVGGVRANTRHWRKVRGRTVLSSLDAEREPRALMGDWLKMKKNLFVIITSAQGRTGRTYCGNNPRTNQNKPIF